MLSKEAHLALDVKAWVYNLHTWEAEAGIIHDLEMRLLVGKIIHKDVKSYLMLPRI